MTRRWPAEVAGEFIPEQEVRESGLLAYVNRALLWPLGMALTVFIEDDGTYQERLRIQRNQPFDPIVGDGGVPAEDIEAQMRRFAEWLADRLRPEEDAA